MFNRSVSFGYIKTSCNPSRTAITKQAIKEISGETIKSINKAVGFRLVTKLGEKGVVNLGKAVPLVGGLEEQSMV